MDGVKKIVKSKVVAKKLWQSVELVVSKLIKF